MKMDNFMYNLSNVAKMNIRNSRCEDELKKAGTSTALNHKMKK